MTVFPSEFKCVEWISKNLFFKISSRQACGICKSEWFTEPLLCINQRELPIIALSNAVTFLASQRRAQEYLKYCKFHFNRCTGGWAKQKKKKKRV